MGCWSVNSFVFSREKLHERFSESAVFPAKNRTNLQTNKTCFALITHLLSLRATISRKMLIDNKFEAQTLTGNSTGNSRCHALASRALNMSCSFGSIRVVRCKWLNIFLTNFYTYGPAWSVLFNIRANSLMQEVKMKCDAWSIMRYITW